MLIAQRKHQAVIGGRGLQFEIEGPAETFAQRQAPGAIDARAERRVNDELHAAGFIEESFGDDGVLLGTAPSARCAGADVGGGLLRVRGGRASIRPSALPPRRQMRRCLRAGAKLRRDSSRVRPGASPRQNGIDGAAPWASSTRTRPGSTRRMRQEVVPSRKTSPTRLSTAKSSSSEPTTVPSGSAIT